MRFRARLRRPLRVTRRPRQAGPSRVPRRRDNRHDPGTRPRRERWRRPAEGGVTSCAQPGRGQQEPGHQRGGQQELPARRRMGNLHLRREPIGPEVLGVRADGFAVRAEFRIHHYARCPSPHRRREAGQWHRGQAVGRAGRFGQRRVDGIRPVASPGRSIFGSRGKVGGFRRLLQLRPCRFQHARRAASRDPEHGRQVGQAHGMAVHQVEDLAVCARESVKRCPHPAVGDRLGVRESKFGRVVFFGNVIISGVQEGESFAQIPRCPGGLRRFARARPGPIAVEAFPAPEREQPGPHPPAVLEAPGQGVTGDQGDLRGTRSSRPVAKETAAVVEQVPGVVVVHLGERVLVACFWPRICWAQRRHSLSLTCHSTPPMRPPPVPLPPTPCRLSRSRLSCCRLKILVQAGCT